MLPLIDVQQAYAQPKADPRGAIGVFPLILRDHAGQQGGPSGYKQIEAVTLILAHPTHRVRDCLALAEQPIALLDEKRAVGHALPSTTTVSRG
jgi:hypothetical protein